jgi:hypothetical protein
MGWSAGNDANWGDSAGGFRSEANRAGSILHKGTSGLAVKVYDGTNYTGAASFLH